MALDREAVRQAIAAVIGVGIFVTALIIIGVVAGDQGLTTTGAFGIIAALGLFIVVMSVIGYWLSGRGS